MTNSKNFRLMTLEKIEQVLFDEHFARLQSLFDAHLKRRLALLLVMLYPEKKFGLEMTPLAARPPFPDDSGSDPSNPESGGAGAPAKLVSGLSPSIQICTLVFLPLIKNIARADPSVYSASLTVLQQVLDSAAPLSLRTEPKMILNAIHDLLDSLLSDEAAIDLDNRRKVFDLFFAIGVSFGTLSSWLGVVRAALNPANKDVFPLSNVSKLAVLDEHQSSFLLSPPKTGTFSIVSCPALDVSQFLSLTRITTDDTYLFIHNGTHILKMGTGHKSTLLGHVYKYVALEEGDAMQSDDFWFVCLGSHLLAGSGLKFATFRCADLERLPWSGQIPLPPAVVSSSSEAEVSFIFSPLTLSSDKV